MKAGTCKKVRSKTCVCKSRNGKVRFRKCGKR